MPDIFISYAQTDRHRVKPLIRALTETGWSVFWDELILAGTDVSSSIEAQLDASRAVVTVWSENSIASKWVRGEANRAMARNILVPVRLDEVVIPLPFAETKFIDFVARRDFDVDATWAELIAALSSVLGALPPTAVLVAKCPRVLGESVHPPSPTHARLELRAGNIEEVARELGRLVTRGDLEGAVAAYGAVQTNLRLTGELTKVVDLAKTVAADVAPPNSPLSAATHDDLGIVHAIRGNFEMAVRHHEASLAIRSRLDDQAGQADSHSHLGNCYAGNHEFDRAIVHHQQALAIERGLERPQNLVLDLCNLARCHVAQACFSDAKRLLQEALAVSRAHDDTRSRALALGNLGRYHWMMDDIPMALADISLALGLEQSLGDVEGLAETHASLAMIHAELGNREQASEHIEHAITFYHALGLTAADHRIRALARELAYLLDD